MKFKHQFTLQQRLNDSNNVLKKYPDRIPVICEKNIKERSNYILDKKKYLVPYDLTIGQFIYILRTRMRLSSDKALYIYINGIIPTTSSLISSLYNNNKDIDKFLYITYTFENTFGYIPNSGMQ
jgi:GABA(A) receptor-associated protein